MSERYSRRDFLAGVLASGTLSAAAMYMAPGGHSPKPITLKLVTGSDPTGGARDLLFDMWNRTHPDTIVDVTPLPGATVDQRSDMEDRAKEGSADILNLDIVHIPYFVERGYITPIELERPTTFLSKTLITGKMSDSDSTGRYWAAPFNTDVGMLFERQRGAGLGSSNISPPLSSVIDNLVRDGSHGFAAQLAPLSTASDEAFVVNILEHALSREEDILSENDGMPTQELERWQNALEPLRTAIDKGRMDLGDSEEDTRDRFSGKNLPYMRNWPVKYRELQQMNDPDVKASRIRVRSLPVGILGGQSLALVEKSRNNARASQLIRFLTGDQAQTILAAYGLAATRNVPYSDPGLRAFIPHLEEIRGAVEHARMRPRHANYGHFSSIVVTHMKNLLQQGIKLPSRFVDDFSGKLNIR